MGKENVLVISRTPWSEAPRIRHQLSRLLRDLDYEVYYIAILYKKKDIDYSGEKGIHLINVKEPIHHQLKPTRLLQFLSASSVKKQIRKTLPITGFKAVFNFNYDNNFIQSLLPDVPVVTIINDDFIAMAKCWMKKTTMKMLTNTCAGSERLLSVSYSLDKQLKSISTGKASLLLPWSDQSYSRPSANQKRDVVLYYGFISRLDESIVEELDKRGVRIRFVGPVEGNGIKFKERFSHRSNIEFLPSQPIEKVKLDDVCCSIALYDINHGGNIAITASNRMFRLLSLGIPLVYPDMPNLIQAPDTVIKRCKTGDDFAAAITFFAGHFDSIQPAIEMFMKDHTVDKRASFLQDLVAGLKK